MRSAILVAPLALLAGAAVGCGGGGDSGGGGGQALTFARPTTPPAAKPTGSELRPARADLYTISVPAGWTRQDKTLTGGLSRSQWRDPAAPGTSVLVDAITGAGSTPQDRAQRNRDRGAAKPGYQERTLEPALLNGRQGWLWEYSLPGTVIVDYFLNDCGDGYAIQGTSPPASAPRLAKTFRSIASSLRSTHC